MPRPKRSTALEKSTVTLAGGSAALTTSALPQGSHSITAACGGDSNNAASTSAVLTQRVNGLAAPATTEPR